MKVLFVHQNFPGQFPHLAAELAQRGHEITVITRANNGRPIPYPTYRYRYDEPDLNVLGSNYAKMAMRGGRVAGLADRMREEKGYVPDVIVGHCGWGETLFLKEVWPEATLLVYSEFFYRTRGLDVGFDPEFADERLEKRVRSVANQAHLAHALINADVILSPTKWQASTHPQPFRDQINVIHDGVDTDLVCPNPKALVKLGEDGPEFRAGDEVLTFVSRKLEPYRGYHSFMRALPKVLKARPNAQVVIVGEDGRGYGPIRVNTGGWKDEFFAPLKDTPLAKRIHFTDRVSYADYLSILQVARVHCYLTYPFVLSWSMLEAMSAGVHLVASATPPVEEVITDGMNGTLVDFFDTDQIADALIEGLANPQAFDSLRQTAIKTAQDQYDLRGQCLPKLVQLLEGLAT
ncbi:glycosyltransferase [Actibacterium pelagium]|uniref:Glycosyl transferase n=1 Tax=Actibacterium pelagium TaxID=2029103 RepID=A0A917AGI9_9RHOB|nr:glycosyltransferase [Actibacterium pelagium]GGE50261.1 glycosyl transferase [Actibacterium pelagium]